MNATFLMGLRPQTLEAFEVISRADMNNESLLALNTHHNETLRELRLSVPHIAALPNLRNCVMLESFYLDAGFVDAYLEEPVISGITAWLRSCKKLRNISLVKMTNSAKIMTPVLLENDIKLLKLELEGYSLSDGNDFHPGLANQTSLQSLRLKGDNLDHGILVDCVARLTNLRELQLKDVSDLFMDEDICHLVRDLDELQMFWTSGIAISDTVLPALVKPKLRNLSFGGVTTFTKDGILKYISSLDPERNRGLALSVLNAHSDSNLTEADQRQIRASISRKVDGSFEFFLDRGSQHSALFHNSMLTWLAEIDSSDSSYSESE
ncbi:hypothetical protein GP486_004675 [Trichoglossum hirsutum]|uniref:Uncharacterized protein n=1 Tax=Trichoglossum hirsutum TaxID=265104 RepID=A0A9P8RP95_9PEZI|nr:hypothetical protein GP486_004675 [Trichoglossum hirsutum]